MKNLILFTAILFTFAFTANAQTSAPAETVTISREAAIKCLENADKAKAQADEIKVKDGAIVELKDEINRLRVELARTVGEKNGAQSELISQRALIELLISKTRKKCFGICVQ